jgi:methyl-accepting chemotaxis protein
MTWVRDRSIGAKLLGTFLALGLIPLIAVSIFSYRSAESALVAAAGTRVEDVAFNAIDKLDRNLFERYGDVQAFAVSAPARSMDPDRMRGWMDTMMGAYAPIYKLMAVADAHGRIVAVNGVDLDGRPLPATSRLLQQDVSRERWFREAFEGRISDGAAFVEDLHHDALMKTVYGAADGADLAMSFTAPIKDVDGTIVGVWTNRFNWEVGTKVLADVQQRAQASGMTTLRLGLVGANGTLLAGSDAADILRTSFADRPSVRAAATAPTGYLAGHSLANSDEALEGWARSAGFATYAGIGWTVISSQDQSEILRPARQLGMTTFVAVGLAAVVIGVGAWTMARYLVRRIDRVGAIAHRLAQGDLRETLEADSTDELGKMAAAMSQVIGYQRQMAALATTVAAGDLTAQIQPKSDHDALGAAFEAMVTNLRSLIGQVRASADGLANTSGQLGQAASQTSGVVQQVTQAVQNVAMGAQDTSRSAQTSNEAVDQLSQAIDSIARGAADQARQVQTAASTTGQMAASIDQVASNAQAVAAASQETKVSAEYGAQAVRETVEGMREIQAVVSTAAGKVEELGRLGEKIGAVVETIDDIAEQTNLLALNAAIEAARAGEHGRGFAVVADEVRKLAERSQRETKAISDLIREVQSGTKDAVTAMEIGSVKVEQGTLKADQAGASLGEILTAVEATVRQVSGIAASAQEMSAGARAVVDTMSGISAVVEENTAATEEMAAQAGQVTAAIQSIAAVSEENSAATEEVSASAEEMSAQVEEMNAQAEELATTAEQLKGLVARFRIENVDGTADVPPISRRRAEDWSSRSASSIAQRSA